MTEGTRRLADTTRLALRQGYRLQWEPRQESWVLLFPEGMVQLNETAGLILTECRQPIAVAELIARLQARFPGEAIADDVRAFLSDAHEQRWLEPH